MLKHRMLGAVAAAALLVAGAAGAEPLRFAGATPALTMDPHATNDVVTTAVFRQVYDSLVGLGVEMDLVPGIATSWDYLGDNTWRFALREGVRFHDGSSLTAEDVAFSILRQKDSRFYRSLFGAITEVRIVDAATIDVISSEPDPVLPRKMARLFVMSRAWAEAHGVVEIPDLGAEGTEAFSVRNAMGTGPMRLISHDPSVETRFEAFAGHWDDAPGNVTTATYSVIGSGPTRVAALLSGEVDLVVDLPLQDIPRVQATPGFSVSQAPQLIVMQLEMDGSRDQALATFDRAGNPLAGNPFRDPRVRQAIAHAVDAPAIVERVMRGHARTVGIAATPGMGGYQADLDIRWPTDLDRARALLAEAGYGEGFVTTLNCPLDRYVNGEDICRAVAGMMARIGIEVRVNGMVWPEFARMLVNGPDSSFHLIALTPNTWDAQESFYGHMLTRDPEANRGFWNWALWSDPEFDAVALALPTVFDEAERTALYRRGLDLARERVHAVYLHQPMIVWGMRERVEAPIRADAAVTLQNVVIR